MSEALIDTKNALDITDDTRQIVFKRISEQVLLEENTTVIETDTYGHSWIVGSSTNGLVGTNTATEDGQQQVVGSAGRVQTIVSVLNINNIFREYFRDASFEDTSYTTADWSDTSGECNFTTGEIAQSLTIAKNGTTWTSATLSVSSATNLTLFMTAQLDNLGSYTFNNGTDTDMTYTGDDPLDGSNVSAVFNGSSSNISLGLTSADFNSGMSLSIWIKPSDISTAQDVWTFSDDQVLYISSNNIYFKVKNDIPTTSIAYASISGLQDTWIHITGTYDGSDVRIYVNGIEGTSDSLSGDTRDRTIGTRIGTNYNASGRFFTGNIGYCRAWTTALTPTEILTEMNSAYPVKSTNLIGNWDLNGDSLDVGIFERCINGVSHSFTNTGDEIGFRIVASDTAQLTWVKINYN